MDTCNNMDYPQLLQIHYLPNLLLLVDSSHSMLKREDDWDGSLFELLELELANDREMKKAFLRKQP